jgi:hypothetical protein
MLRSLRDLWGHPAREGDFKNWWGSRLPKLLPLRAREARRHGSSRRRAMGPLREAALDRDWQGEPRLPKLLPLRAREARRHGRSRRRAMGPLREAARDRDWQGGLVSLAAGSAR